MKTGNRLVIQNKDIDYKIATIIPNQIISLFILAFILSNLTLLLLSDTFILVI